MQIKRHLKWDFTYASYFKLHGSTLLYQLAFFWHCIFRRHFATPKFQFPWKL